MILLEFKKWLFLVYVLRCLVFTSSVVQASSLSNNPPWDSEKGILRFRNFCNQLWSKENQGNYSFTVENEKFTIQHGKDEFELKLSNIELYKRIIAIEEKLPVHFQKLLTKKNYFKKLSAWLEKYEHRQHPQRKEC